MKRRYGGNTRLNNTFNDMKQRCYNPKNKNFKEYGGRGITICDEWLDKEVVHYPATKGWLAFEKWALSNGYADNLTIDRIDVNKGYSPENCRWVTMKVQGNNRRTTRQIFYKGKIQSLKQWCDDLGFNRQTMEYRINKKGWSVERAFETK